MISKFISILITIAVFITNSLGISITDKINYEYLDLSYGEHERQVLDLYIPKNCDDETGLVLLIHGGWWLSGDKESYHSFLKWIADNQRVAAAAINYRYVNEETDIFDLLDDIESALTCIKEKGEENGTNINRVILRGYSAGGHLSLLYAYSRADTSPITPVAVFSDAGLTDLYDENYYINSDEGTIFPPISYAIGETFTYGNRHTVKEKLESVSPLYYVNESTVPTVINHGMKDNVVPFSNAVSLDKKLTEFGIEHEFNVYPNSDHGLSSDEEQDDKADRFFETYCKLYLK